MNGGSSTGVPTASRAALEQLAVNTIRFLAADAVEKAKSGHPGMPMGMADAAFVLWTRFLRYQPADPAWPGRDRFVLSAGHGSMLLYALLPLSGYDMPIEEPMRFRQLGSRIPGHPEHGLTPGVETTTGPLGQGLANAVGMALGSKMADARFAGGGFSPGGYRVFAIAGDGCMMEGISHEAGSLAGHLQLGNLTVLYDDNHITIDGSTSIAFSDDTAKRFEAYGWHVQRVADGNDLSALDAALAAARRTTERPSLVIVRTHIAFGSPGKQDTAEAHGAPLGADEVKRTKQHLGWPSLKPFHVPAESLAQWRRAQERGAGFEAEWRKRWDAYRTAHRDLAAELERRHM